MKNSHKILLIIVVVSNSMAISCNQGTTETKEQSDVKTTTTTTTTDQTVGTGKSDKKNDQDFLVKAAETNLEIVRFSQLAEKNSTMSEVKKMAMDLEKSLSTSMSEMTTLAKKKSITIPTSTIDNAQEAYKKISNKTGATFDKDYCEMVVNRLKNMIAGFEKNASESADQDIKDWAKNSIPTLKSRLEESIVCQKKCEKM